MAVWQPREGCIHRVEVFLDPSKVGGYSPHILEYYAKVLKEDVPPRIICILYPLNRELDKRGCRFYAVVLDILSIKI